MTGLSSRLPRMPPRITDVASRLRDLLLPPVCLGCERLIDRQGQLCPICWSSIRFIEEPYCAVFGTPFSYDLGAGALSAEAIADPPPFDRARAVCFHDDVPRRLLQGLKFNDRTELAPWLAAFMARAGRECLDDPSALIMPVPLHRRRLFARRYNQSAELARPLAALSGTTYRADLLIRSRATRQQVGLGAEARDRNVRGAFRLIKGGGAEIKGRHVILVDDVYTTGATLKACARVLRRAGAERIDCITFSKVAAGDFADHIPLGNMRARPRA